MKFRFCQILTLFCVFLQAALPKRSTNESVLAIQPHQADQPDTEKQQNSESSGLWKTCLIWGGVVVGILTISALVAPLCHYGSTRIKLDPAPVFQRLVGEF